MWVCEQKNHASLMWLRLEGTQYMAANSPPKLVSNIKGFNWPNACQHLISQGARRLVIPIHYGSLTMKAACTNFVCHFVIVCLDSRCTGGIDIDQVKAALIAMYSGH